MQGRDVPDNVNYVSFDDGWRFCSCDDYERQQSQPDVTLKLVSMTRDSNERDA